VISIQFRITSAPEVALAVQTDPVISAPEVAAETTAVRPVLCAAQSTAPGSVVPDLKQIHTGPVAAWPVYFTVNGASL